MLNILHGYPVENIFIPSFGESDRIGIPGVQYLLYINFQMTKHYLTRLKRSVYFKKLKRGLI